MAILGAQKAGTSSLLTLLARHPRLVRHRGDELALFLDDAASPDVTSATFRRRLAAHYPPADARLRLAKSAGLLLQPRALERLHRHNPDAAVVALLRHPVERAWSAFWFARLRGWEPVERFEDALVASPERFATPRHAHLCAYVERGLYAEPVRRVLATFPEARVTLRLTEDLERDPQSVVATVLRSAALPAIHAEASGRALHERSAARPRSAWLARGLARGGGRGGRALTQVLRGAGLGGLLSPMRRTLLRWNARPFEPPPMEPATRRRLLERFADSNRELARLLGRDLAHWDR